MWGYYGYSVYRAKGRPKLSVLAQVLQIVVLWPVVLIAVKYGFETLYVARSLVRLEQIAVNLCIMGWIVKMPVVRMFTNVFPSCFAAVCMCLVLLLPSAGSCWMSIIYAGLAAIIYISVIMMFPEDRKMILNLPRLLTHKK